MLNTFLTGSYIFTIGLLENLDFIPIAPILRMGIISAKITEKLNTVNLKPPFYLAELFSKGGMSGSPVFANKS